MATSCLPASVPVVSTGMPFVVSSNDGRVDPATRKLIRSHAMRGRKQKRVRPRRNVLVNDGDMTIGYLDTAPVDFGDITRTYTPPARRIGSDLSFVALPEDFEQSVLQNIVKVSPIAQRVVYPLIAAIGNQAANREWLNLCTQDAAALHITAYSIEGFVDMFLHRRDQVNPAAMVHYQKGLKLLQQRLSGEDESLRATDVIIGIVLKLATAAHVAGDYQAAQYHMNGVRKMVDSRGGLEWFKASFLYYEMLRCDLSIAMSCRQTQVFFRQPSEALPEYRLKLLLESEDSSHSSNTKELIGNVVPELAEAWSVMSRFCLLVNLGEQTQRLISTTVINETMASVMYRLVYMHYPADSLDEAVRLGLLAYCYHVFLQWRGVPMPYLQFRTAFRRCIQGLEQRKGVSSHFMLWTTMVGAISIFDPPQDEAWLSNVLRSYVCKCEANSWKDVQEILKSFMWISLLDERTGRYIYDSLA